MTDVLRTNLRDRIIVLRYMEVATTNPIHLSHNQMQVTKYQPLSQDHNNMLLQHIRPSKLITGLTQLNKLQHPMVLQKLRAMALMFSLHIVSKQRVPNPKLSLRRSLSLLRLKPKLCMHPSQI